MNRKRELQARRKSWSKSDSFRRVKLAAKRLIGREPRFKRDIRIPLQRSGGWRFSKRLLRAGDIVYSLGVGEDIDLDLEVIESADVEVHAFDPTPNSIAWLVDRQSPRQFHFHPWAVSDQDGSMYLYPRVRRDGSRSKVMYTIMAEPEVSAEGVQVPAKTLTTIMNTLGHSQIDLLKIDIEGAEYALLEQLCASGIRPAQILVEFHHRFPSLDVSQTLHAVERLRAAGYGLADISPTGREYTFIRIAALRA